MMEYTNTQAQILKNSFKVLCFMLLLAISIHTQAQNAILTTIFEDDFEDSDLVDPVTNFKPSVGILSSVGFDLCPEQFVTLEAQSTGGGFAPLYQWFINDAATNLSTANQTFPTTTLQDGDIIKVNMVSTSPCPLPQTVSSAPQLIRVIQPQITIITSPQVCANQSPVTFTAEYSGGGANPTFQWFINGQPSPENNDEPFKFTFDAPVGNGGQTIQVRLTPSGNCGNNVFDLSQTLSLSVVPVAPTSVSITSQIGSGQSVCTNDIITFSASAVNAGTNPIYKWIVNGDTLQASGSNTFQTNQFLPNQINQIQVKLVSSQACASPVEQVSPIY